MQLSQNSTVLVLLSNFILYKPLAKGAPFTFQTFSLVRPSHVKIRARVHKTAAYYYFISQYQATSSLAVL